MELYERLLKLTEFFEENSQTKFAKRIGVSQTTFWGYLNRNGQSKIRKALLDKINLVYPQINRDWLFFGEGEMLQSDTPAKETAPTAPPVIVGLELREEPIVFCQCPAQPVPTEFAAVPADEVVTLRAEVAALTKDLIHAQKKLIDLHEQIQGISSSGKDIFPCHLEVPAVATGVVIGVHEDGRR